MSPLTFYIVYHKILYEENTKDFTSEQKKRILKWVAVNEEITKEYPEWIEGNVLKEWEMPHHSPLYQMLHWQQNSFFHHLFWNRQDITTKYIEFGQYDQMLDSAEFERLTNVLQNDKGDKLFGSFTYTLVSIYHVFSQSDWNTIFIKNYNNFYKMKHELI